MSHPSVPTTPIRRSRALARVGAAGLALGLGLALMPTAVASGPSAPTDLPSSTDQRAAAGGSCASRLTNPRKPVASATFARCVVAGMSRARTAVVRSRHSEGPSSVGPMRFVKKTDASVRYSDGSALVVIGNKTWYRAPGRPWARPGTRTEDEMMADMIAKVWRATSSAQTYRATLSQSSTGWQYTGKQRRINKVRAREYTGTMSLGEATFDHYAVWVDAKDRPIRIESTGTLYGVTVTSRQDFRGWGKPVKIVPPKVK